MTRPTTTITLRALEGQPLADRAVRDMVVAAAKALAERHGVEVIDVATAPDRVTCTLATHRIAALGFAAELRRTTTAWYEHKHGAKAMWGDAHDDLHGAGPEEPPGSPAGPPGDASA